MRDSSKYPRTLHWLFSPGTTSDDRIAEDLNAIEEHFKNNPYIETEKLDGQNNCLNNLGIFARSHSAPSTHPWDKHLWDKWELIKNDLGTLEFFGENMFAVHSIEYLKLEHHFYVFAIRDGERWLSWEEVKFYASLLDFPTVPVIYEGPYRIHPNVEEYTFPAGRYEKFNKNLFARTILADIRQESALYGVDLMTIFKDTFKILTGGLEFEPKKKDYPANIQEIIVRINKMVLEEKLSVEGMKEISCYKTKEGTVTRTAAEFQDQDFSANVFKYVRKGHVQTDEHWVRNWKRQRLAWEYRGMNL